MERRCFWLHALGKAAFFGYMESGVFLLHGHGEAAFFGYMDGKAAFFWLHRMERRRFSVTWRGGVFWLRHAKSLHRTHALFEARAGYHITVVHQNKQEKLPTPRSLFPRFLRDDANTDAQ